MQRRFLALALTLLAATACRRSAPEAPPAPKAARAVEVLKEGRWLFTYVEPAGTFTTTDKPDSVPAGSRAVVRVFDPSDPAKTDAPGQVYVTDLNEVLKSGKAAARALSRQAFETAALAQLPPGASSALAERGSGDDPGATPPPSSALRDQHAQPQPPPTSSAPSPVVTIYGTSWCGACRSARQYLTQRRIPFADKDVERDPGAARELAEKAGKLGIPTDRVPIIEVRGRLLQGFDRARIDALLGEPT